MSKFNRYMHYKNFFSKEMTDLFHEYSIMMRRHKKTVKPDHACPLSEVISADPLLDSVNVIIKPKIEEIVELKLLPTYAYSRIYAPGDKMAAHTDRPSCEISMTALLAKNYVNDNYFWPIIMEGKEVNLNIGDGAIYRGCEVEHERKKFRQPKGCWHFQAFFHFVNANGPLKEYKWDKRNFMLNSENIK